MYSAKYTDDLVLLAMDETVLQDWKMLWSGNECGKN
jgi:hypothetical protein